MTQPQWAALDFGSNTVMLLVARELRDGRLVHEGEWLRTTRLGRGLDRTGLLDDGAIGRSLAAAGVMLAESRRPGGLQRGVAVATSAVREATNREDFLERCARELGFRPLVLSGEEEARFLFRGVVGDRAPDCPVVHIDVGGGSTEITAGLPGRCIFAESIPAGCVRLGERFGLRGPAPAARRSAARQAVRTLMAPVLARLGQAFPEARDRAVVLATGGTATTYAAMRLELTAYDRDRVHGCRGDRDGIRAALDLLSGLAPSARTRRFPGVPADRAAVLPAGLLILEVFLTLFGAETFTVSTRGLRAGLIEALRAGEIDPLWEYPI